MPIRSIELHLKQFFFKLPSESPDFLESSWKGRAIQVLCVASFLALIYYVAFRHKRTDNPPSQDPPSLASRFEIRVMTFTAWLSEKIRESKNFVDLKREIQELKAQLKIMIPIFQAHPGVSTTDWDAFLKKCDAVADGEEDLERRCNDLNSFLAHLQYWNNALHRHLKAAEGPDFLELYHFKRLLNVSKVACDRLIGKKRVDDLDLLSVKKRGLFKPTVHKIALRVFVDKLRVQVEKMTPVFQSCPRDRVALFVFFRECNTIKDFKISKRICMEFRQSLVFLENQSATLCRRYHITESLKGSDFIKAFLKYFNIWLPAKIEFCNDVISLALAAQLTVGSQVLKTFITDLKVQVEKMVFVFQVYSEIKTEDLTAFIADCDRLEIEEGALHERSLAFKSGLEKLQSWSLNYS